MLLQDWSDLVIPLCLLRVMASVLASYASNCIQNARISDLNNSLMNWRHVIFTWQREVMSCVFRHISTIRLKRLMFCSMHLKISGSRQQFNNLTIPLWSYSEKHSHLFAVYCWKRKT